MRTTAIAVPLIAVALAALVVRVAIVEAYSDKAPAVAAAVWPGHPSITLESGLTRIGNDVREGRPVGRGLVESMIDTAVRAPLAPEPFLVRGVDATLRGQAGLAGRSFVAARDRDPRSVAARYFLADHFLRTGHARQGLNEISALTRLIPGSLSGIGPYLAAYARDPEAARAVRSMLRQNPELGPVVLNALAADARDASLAMSLWPGDGSDRLQPWQNRLLNSLIAAGRYRDAKSAWMRFTRRSGKDEELALADFVATGQGPFGWTLVSGSSGVAEAEAEGKLRVIYFGRDDIVLANRVLMLRPGRYRLSMQVNGRAAPTGSLEWTIGCLPSGKEIARLGLASGFIRTSFDVQAGDCDAQRIKLAATSTELPEKTQLTIDDFRIEREDGQ